MSNIPLLIIGSSGHAKVIIDIVEKQGKFRIVGLIDSYKEVGTELLGYRIIGDEAIIINEVSKHKNLHLFIAIGDNSVRHRVYNRIRSLGVNLPFATLVHPSAIIGKNVSIGAGSAIMAGCIVNPDTIVGEFVIINTASSIDHDCIVNDFATVAPGAVLGGNVSIGRFSVVSIGATVRHGLALGDDSIVGAGAVVIKSIPNNEIQIGVPSKKFRERFHGEKYL